MKARRVVTGHGGASKSVFAGDSIVEPDAVPKLGFEFLKLWGATALQPFPTTAGGAQKRQTASRKTDSALSRPLGRCRMPNGLGLTSAASERTDRQGWVERCLPPCR